MFLDLDSLSAGENVPDEVNVVIEIPAHSAPVKYELDKESGAMMVDRFMNVAMFYPCNYGFIPHTLSEDGDPVDVLVLTPVPVISGCFMACRPIGILNMTDETGPDAKIIAVPSSKLHTLYDDVESTSDLPKTLLGQIGHFFEQYKSLESNKWVRLEGWSSTEDAKAEITAGINRYVKSRYMKRRSK